MKKLSSLLLAYAILLILATCGGGTTNETPAADIPASEAPALETLATEAPAESGEPAAAPDPSTPVTQLYYSSDIAELEGAWTLAQVHASGETFNAAIGAAAFAITFSLDPSELADQAAHTHNQVYNLIGDLAFGVAAISDVLFTDGLDGYRGSTSQSDFLQDQVMMESEFYQQPGPTTMRFQDVDAYGLFLNQLAAGAPADVDAIERNLILGLNNQGQLLLGASEEHLERPGEEGN